MIVTINADLPTVVLCDMTESMTRQLYQDLRDAELAIWQAAYAMHDTADVRSTLWSAPRMHSYHTTTTFLDRDFSLSTHNDVRVIAEREPPTLYCTRNEDW